jgi:hypothetical protein
VIPLPDYAAALEILDRKLGKPRRPRNSGNCST